MTDGGRDITRCPWPHKVAHATEASAIYAQRQWKFAKAAQPSRVYRCPCQAWHTGRTLGAEHVPTINSAPEGTRAENLAWDRINCEWCWKPVVRAYLVDTTPEHIAFCRSGHARAYRRWLSRFEREEILSLCTICEQEYLRVLIAGNGQQLYCSSTCKARAKRGRRTMRKAELAGRALVMQTGRARQDPEVVRDAVGYLRSCKMFPWPEVDVVAVDWMGDGQIAVVADKMPALILVGVGPLGELDLAVRDGAWIVWDGYAGSPGLRNVALWAGLRPPACLELTGEWIEKSLLSIIENQKEAQT